MFFKATIISLLTFTTAVLGDDYSACNAKVLIDDAKGCIEQLRTMPGDCTAEGLGVELASSGGAVVKGGSTKASTTSWW